MSSLKDIQGRWCQRLRRASPPRAFAFAFALAVAPAAVAAQATAPVPLEDPTYALIDRLAAQLGPGELIHGQRPYSRLEVARLTREMRAELDRLTASASPPPPARVAYLQGTLTALEARYAEELSLLDGGAADPAIGLGASLGTVRLDASMADSPFRGFRWNGLGSADNAQVNPLLDYRHGRPLVDGFTGALELEPRLQLGRRGVLFGGARVGYMAPRDGDDDADVTLHTGAARTKLGRWAFQVGRSQIRRGQGRDAGLLFSDNGPPLDMILLQNEELFRIPLLHRLLGPARFSAFFSDLGPEQNFPHAKLYGNWLTFRPARRLELGGGFIVQDGGEGGPEQSIWERVGDYLLFVDVLFQSGTDFQASNKIAGIDFRLWLPEIGAVTYGELYLDDFRVFNWNHVREMLWPDAAHVFGVSLPRLDGVGRLSAWAEYQHTGLRIYRHYDYSSGVTRGRFLLGSGLGSDAHGVVGGFDFAASPAATLSLEAAWEERRHDEWTAPEDPYFHFEKVEDHPTEVRRRLQLAWDYRPLDRAFGWRVEGGIEGVKNFGFVQGDAEKNAALRVVLEWRP
jgi:hypothetical protein